MNHYIGIPYAYKGDTAEGCDCWGLVRLFYREQFGVDLPSYDEQHAAPTDLHGIRNAVDIATGSDWSRVPRDECAYGDVLVIRMRRLPVHVGVSIGDGLMLHVLEGVNSSVERWDGVMWRNRILGVYRHVSEPARAA